jgi:transposase
VEVVYERCAGLDVGKDEVVACIRVPDGAGGRRQEVHPTFSSGLESLAEWLQDHDVAQVVLEATGQQLEADLVCVGGARAGAVVGQRPAREDPARPQD